MGTAPGDRDPPASGPARCAPAHALPKRQRTAGVRWAGSEGGPVTHQCWGAGKGGWVFPREGGEGDSTAGGALCQTVWAG